MTPATALRSFAITLTIAISIVGPRASGFTIHRTNSTPTTLSTELSSNESFRLQVRDDIKRPNDNTSRNEDSNRTTTSNESNKVIEKVSKSPEMKTGNGLYYTRTTTVVPNTSENVKIPTISSDTVEVFDSVEDTTLYSRTKNTTSYSKESVKLKESNLKITEKSMENKEITSTPSSFSKTDPSVELLTIVDRIVTELDKSGDYPTRKTVERSILDSEKTTQLYNVTETPIISETSIDILTMKESDFNKTEFSMTTDLPQIFSKISNASEFTIDDISIQTKSSNSSDSAVALTTTDSINTKMTESLSGKYPKYITIVRIQTTNSEETTATPKIEDDAMRAETSNTQVNFEKALNVTSMPSLVEKLKADLLSNINQQTISGEVNYKTEKVTREVEFTTQFTAKNTEPETLGTVETKRAGFLDNSDKTTTPVIASVNEEIKENSTKTYGTVNFTAVTESGGPDYKKVSGSESQSQMAEDAIQEEFLKEEAFNNIKENAIRYHDQRTGTEVVQLANSGALAGTGVEDSLSVQPIERTKTTLYTPSPNYKPMKKIDVQPAKLFVRDPDDNSWRNESISSLGIVFKPKNSSKSFKEVLKNKTQTELNNLIERFKDDVPHLRERLEKIAEDRKTKKRKMNKDGELVYTDYEENSAETSSSSKPEQMSLAFNSADVANLKPSNSQPDLPANIEQEITTPMTTLDNLEGNKEKITRPLDLFSRLGLDPLSTLKPRKYFNIAEYYDTTDEYDADYVTMSKLDLKKFTVPSRTTHPAPLITKPIEPYIPERRATVQYFPPRDPPVNVNNVDQDFERKIKLFTFKDHSRIEPRPAVVTLSPLPIATVKPESEARVLQPVHPHAHARPDTRSTDKPTNLMYPPELNKNYYSTNSPTTIESEAFQINSGRLDRGSYVIKHYKDLLSAAVDDDERGPDFLPYYTTQPPRETGGPDEVNQTYKPRVHEDDYDTRFRKEVLTRFVDNFNQNSERFKVDFPILYNNSIVHRKGAGSPASSRTFLKRLYEEGVATKASGLLQKPCEPSCELTVELSPAYELHYYVPNQEERELQQPRAQTPPSPYRYGL